MADVYLIKRVVLLVIAIGLIFFGATLPIRAHANDSAIIRRIHINSENVFENISEENGLLYKGANLLHIKTRNEIIKQQLLFKEGDTYSATAVEESERILRSNKYIRDAHIEAMKQGNEVIIYVFTSDTWSTKPVFSFGSIGGKNKSEIGFEEGNLLGRGIFFSLSYRQDIDRSSTNLKISDKNLFQSRYRLDFQHSELSDGKLDYIAIEKPFFSLNSHFGYGVSYRQEAKGLSLYHLGEAWFNWDQQEEESDLYWGWSDGLKTNEVLRHNLGFHLYQNLSQASSIQPQDNNAIFSSYVDAIPFTQDRTEIYPYYSFDFLENLYDTTKNQDKIARTEDRYLGKRLGMQIGFIGRSFGSSEDFLRIESYGDTHKQWSDSVFSSAGFAFDVEYSPGDEEFSNLLFNYYSRLYIAQAEKWRFYADIVGTEGYKLRYDRQIFMDDNMGFRGYPLRYFSGDSAQKLTLEQRYFCSNDLWHIFNFGAAAFFDLGRISGGTPFEREQNGIYKTVGLGLRIASNRSSTGDIIHIDMAMPLDAPNDLKALQFTITSKATF